MADEKKETLIFLGGTVVGTLATLFVVKVLIPSKTELTVTEAGQEVMKVVQAQVR